MAAEVEQRSGYAVDSHPYGRRSDARQASQEDAQEQAVTPEPTPTHQHARPYDPHWNALSGALRVTADILGGARFLVATR
jgi:hypothetical protein